MAYLGMTRQDRITLTGLGLLALAGLAVTTWLRRPLAFSLEARPSASEGPVLKDGAGATWDAALASSRRVDLNAATADELARLPEIGPALAARIVADRAARGPFRLPQDLERVPGIGPRTRQALEPYLTIEAQP